MRRLLSVALWLPLLAGCVMVEVGVTNPVVGLTTVAVAPFFNLSQERAVDGRRFAMAYFTELQKTPGFQVIPVGVVEQAMFDHHLEMNNPDDVLQLAQLLGADAVVVGAVTDYSAYYPPRIGMQVSWYSPKPWTFYPGIPTDELAREMVKPRRLSLFRHSRVVYEECPPETAAPAGNKEPANIIPRGQSPEDRQTSRPRTVSLPEFLLFGEDGPAARQIAPAQSIASEAVPRELASALNGPSSAPLSLGTVPSTSGELIIQRTEPFDPHQPLMSYTRMFDGADPKLTARLRDFVELSGDLRAGGWESYLYRSEDFIRFTAHVMIVEMLQMHGGEARKRVVFKLRKYR